MSLNFLWKNRPLLWRNNVGLLLLCGIVSSISTCYGTASGHNIISFIYHLIYDILHGIRAIRHLHLLVIIACIITLVQGWHTTMWQGFAMITFCRNSAASPMVIYNFDRRARLRSYLGRLLCCKLRWLLISVHRWFGVRWGQFSKAPRCTPFLLNWHVFVALWPL